MIRLRENRLMIQTAVELPDCSHKRLLYVDFETASFDPKRGGDYPWGGDRICGAAVTFDDCPTAWYVPVRHAHASANIPLDAFQRWLKDTVGTCTAWVNHNVKFDAHFAATDGAEFTGELVDTITLAKLVDSDRTLKGGYGLDALCHTWLSGYEDRPYQRVEAYLRGVKSKDYADVPADTLGEYACGDVLETRRLHQYLEQQRTPDQERVWDIERRLTPVLYDIEREGLRVDPTQLKVKELVLLTEMAKTAERLKALTGRECEPSNPHDCYELLVTTLGLPVLSWQDDENVGAKHTPSFDKEALSKYAVHPIVLASERLAEVIRLMTYYRKRATLLNLFVQPFQVLAVNGRIHPQYNQLVRTGRMSSRQPNSQQQNSESKALILPDEGGELLDTDASQIEFRLIVHYIQDEAAIAAYSRDADTDFHQWVADMCGIQRRPAKNVNFAIAYGGGKKRILSMLSQDPDLIGHLSTQVDQLIADGKIGEDRRVEAFQSLAYERAREVYTTYHATLPGVRSTSEYAAAQCRRSGYVFNAYGRRRHLPPRAAHRAFNSVMQGFASDILKAGMVKLAPRYCSFTRDRGISIRANVHDSLLWHGHSGVLRDPDTVRYLLTELETPLVPLRVPIRFNAGWSDRSWADAASKDAQLTVTREAIYLRRNDDQRRSAEGARGADADVPEASSARA